MWGSPWNAVKPLALDQFLGCVYASLVGKELKAFPFFDSQEELETLKAELPAYLAKAADVDSSIDPLQWWQRNASALPHWVAAACKVLLVQPSSAASERVFSLFNASFQGQ